MPSGIPISRTLDFSNLPTSRTNFRFPWINFSVILLPISRTSIPISRTNFRFPWIKFSVILLSISPMQPPDFANQFPLPLDELLCNFTLDSVSNLPFSPNNFRFPWINLSVILLSIQSRTSRFLEPIFFSLGG